MSVAQDHSASFHAACSVVAFKFTSASHFRSGSLSKTGSSLNDADGGGGGDASVGLKMATRRSGSVKSRLQQAAAGRITYGLGAGARMKEGLDQSDVWMSHCAQALPLCAFCAVARRTADRNAPKSLAPVLGGFYTDYELNRSSVVYFHQ